MKASGDEVELRWKATMVEQVCHRTVLNRQLVSADGPAGTVRVEMGSNEIMNPGSKHTRD
ncbi:MAG: hypothetical protein CMQ21_00230 [Gammaproteobacteria bacterium]|jgi:hypothetical protein|nr:hypothetical protein [Gammaproteobacteria bacterium]|tara:strand:+ start:1046 stop:1225 length:180 start_codon:yes stop_codon:yes gene_type:complete